jgi:Raf kinase inhibitor-like YbhB/YbcL family protein
MSMDIRRLIKLLGRPLLFLAMVTIVAGCSPASQAGGQAEGGDGMQIRLSSTAFKDGETIPAIYTCDGKNVSPPLSWTEPPQGSKSLALIVDDPDAPAGTWVHWVVFNLPPSMNSLSEGASSSGNQEPFGTAGMNSYQKSGYGGPCPPKGKPHRYFFKLYSLDIMLGLKTGASKAAVEKAMQGHILAQGQLMGTYGR